MRTLAFVGCWLAATTAVALAGAYAEGSGAGRCPSLLASNVYRCAVQVEGGGSKTDCFHFSTGQTAAKFEFASDLLGASVGCSCEPGGSTAKPDFNASAVFTCATGLGVSFTGRVNKDGSIGDGSITNAQGGTYAFSCTHDDACAASP